tara:strand:+ start:288 stop:1433 length:1146 start_codon:yes stop_codon:yes gene_type:complete
MTDKDIKILLYFIISSFILILITNSYFDYADSAIYGGSDGRFYIKISDSFPNFATNVEYIKGERFLIPFLIGSLGHFFSIDNFLIYRFLSIFLSIIFIFVFVKIILKFNLDLFSKFASIGLIIFNPYLIRYFLAVPTSILDLIFIISSLIILLGFYEKKFFLILCGFSISLIARQNAIIFLSAFVIAKIFFKKKSFLSNHQILYLIIAFIFIFFLNTFYAINAAGIYLKLAKGSYIETLAGIFIDNYNYKEFIQYILMPFFSFGPLIIFILFKFFNTELIDYKNETTIIVIVSSILIIMIGFVSGPIVTGKNLIRLSNLSYPMILIIVNQMCESKTALVPNKIKTILLSLFLVFWSFHPTFSNVEMFVFIKHYFNNLLLVN